MLFAEERVQFFEWQHQGTDRREFRIRGKGEIQHGKNVEDKIRDFRRVSKDLCISFWRNTR